MMDDGCWALEHRSYPTLFESWQWCNESTPSECSSEIRTDANWVRGMELGWEAGLQREILVGRVLGERKGGMAMAPSTPALPLKEMWEDGRTELEFWGNSKRERSIGWDEWSP